MRDKRIAAGVVLLAAAIAVTEIVFPHKSYIVISVALLLAGCVLVARGWRSQYGSGEERGRRVRPLEPGERYDRPVKLARVANTPIAELWRQRLHHEGIEAFHRGSLLRNPSMPVTLWVGEHDLDRARELFPELQQSPR